MSIHEADLFFGGSVIGKDLEAMLGINMGLEVGSMDFVDGDGRGHCARKWENGASRGR